MISTTIVRLSRGAAFGTILGAGLLVSTITLATGTGCGGAPGDSEAGSADDQALAAIAVHPTQAVCTTGHGRFQMRCAAEVRTDIPDGYEPNADLPFATPEETNSGNEGVSPTNLRAAYAVPDGGEGVTVGIIDAFDDPDIEADLQVYRKKFGLPECTTANGCFKKVAADGSDELPPTNTGWAGEITLDVDTVSAICPKCKILLVEANEDDTTATVDPLATAVDTAVKLGATYISNSYGAVEASNADDGILKADALATATHYVHDGVAIFASSGDDGYAATPNNSQDGKGAAFPADVPGVFAVGGTTLAASSSTRGWAEKVWGPADPALGKGAANSGCSTFFPKPSYQKDKGCTGRAIADLSADADPASGLDMYITFVDPNGADGIKKGWNVIGGTSLASPLTASIFAAAGVSATTPSFVYANSGDFHDVTSGNNGTCSSSHAYLCKGGTGYDGPTGIGTPNATSLAK